ncbi:MAG: methyltransferase [Oscillospiraceae bacterium]|nr:methyltransferase [Oscillospiraceae bacterium]
MEQLPNGYTLELAEGCFPLSTDSMLLAHFARLPRNAQVLDLGSGCGTLGLLLCAKDETCTVTGLEISEIAHRAAQENIRRNDLTSRMNSICADLRESFAASSGTFHCCVSNPPYFSGGPANLATPVARRDDCCSPAELFHTASRALRYGGDFFLVHKPEKLAQLIACGASVSLEAKNLTLIRHRDGGPIALILLQFRKGGKSGLQIHEQSLFDIHGKPTAYYRDVYHIQGE